MLRDYGYVNWTILKQEYGVSDTEMHKVGGLKKYCQLNKIPYKKYGAYEKDDIKADFQKVYEKYGTINTEIYLKNGKYSKQAIKTAFGGINNLMKELGIKRNMTRMDSPEDILQDIALFVENYDSTSSQLYRKKGTYSQSVVERAFGSWSNAIEKLGRKSVGKKYGKEFMGKEITRVFEEHGYLSLPLINNECEFTYQAAVASFGSRDKMCEELHISRDAFGIKSTYQHELGEILRDLFGSTNVCEEATFEWLVNPDTGKRMYFDFAIIQRRLLIEYDGEQHFRYVERFHKTKEVFQNARQRDKIKEELAHQNGYDVVRFDYRDTLTRSLVAERLKL